MKRKERSEAKFKLLSKRLTQAEEKFREFNE